MLSETIKVTENGGKTVLVIKLEDCEKYHGLKRCGGLALGFRLLKFALDRFTSTDSIADRNLITFKTAFDGPGIIDSSEYVGRCLTRKRFMVLPSEAIEAPECIWGRLYFEIGYGTKLMKLTVREGVVSQEFLEAGRLFRSGLATPKEIKRWIIQKEKLYEKVINAQLEDIVKVEVIE